MSGYSSKAEVIAVVKDAITSDCNRTGLSTNPADYNLAAIVRENFHSRGAGYGWGVSTDQDGFVASLRRNLRTASATAEAEAPPMNAATSTATATVEQVAPDAPGPGMYHCRLTVLSGHSVTEDMNQAAIAHHRWAGNTVEILGESRVTIVEDEQDTPAGKVRLIGIGNVPAVPLSDVRPGDRIAWNYGQTYTVVRNTKVAANTYELVERGEDGREWTRRKRGTKLVARRPAVTPPPTMAATSYATHCKSCDCTYAAVTSTDGPAIGYEYEPDGFTVSTLRHICWPRDERAGRLVAARRAAAGDHRVRVIRPAYTIEQGDRIVMDGDTVTVLGAARDDTARTVTLTTSYGAPRTVTFNAAVPVVFGVPDETEQLDALSEQIDGDPATLTDEEITRRSRLYRQLIAMHPSPWIASSEETGRVALLRQRLVRLTGEEDRRARPTADPRTVTGTPENVDARASARARGERAAQTALTFDESDRQAMTVAQLRATAGDALALF